MDDIAGLTPTDGNFIVGNGSNFVLESGATARTSLGLGNVENTALSTGNAATASGLNMLPLTSGTNLVKGKTYINTGNSLTHTLPTPSATNEIITIYSLTEFSLDKGSGTSATIAENTKTLCISTGTSSGSWSCMTFAGTAVTF